MKISTLTILTFLIIFLDAMFLSGQDGQDVYTSNEHPDMLPEMSVKGKFSVGTKTITIVNNKHVKPFEGQLQPRALKVEVWYPSNDHLDPNAVYINQTRGGVPFSINGDATKDATPSSLKNISLVVISHGYTGYRTLMYYLGEHLASHGYLVVSIDHTDSTNEDVDPKKNPFSGFKSTLVNRSRDQQFVLDYFSDSEEASKMLGNNISIENAGVVGYSMGGYGAISTIGGCYTFNTQFTTRLLFTPDKEKIKAGQKVLNTCAAGQDPSNFVVDPRWQAMVAFAPWGGKDGVFSDESIRKIKVPSLYISGNLDDVSGYEGIKNQFEQTIATDSYLLTYINARHNIAPHPAPQEAWSNEYDFGQYYEPAWSTQQLNRINQHFTLAMMNCYLQKDKEACAYLDLSPSSDQPTEDGKMANPWKGFDHRFSTGMKWDMKKVEE